MSYLENYYKKQLRKVYTPKQLKAFTFPQLCIMALLQNRESIIVSNAYLPDALSLQSAGFISHQEVLQDQRIQITK